MDERLNTSLAKGTTLAISMGVHYRLVAFGSTAGARALIYGTVNVASRLQNATWRLGSPLVVSDEGVRAIQRLTPPMR